MFTFNWKAQSIAYLSRTLLTSGVVVVDVDVVDIVVVVVVAVVEVVVILPITSFRSGEHNAGSSVSQQYLYHFTVN